MSFSLPLSVSVLWIIQSAWAVVYFPFATCELISALLYMSYRNIPNLPLCQSRSHPTDSSDRSLQPIRKHSKPHKEEKEEKSFRTELKSFKRDFSLRQLRPRGQIRVNQISITELTSPCVADVITLITVILGGAQKRTSRSLWALFSAKDSVLDVLNLHRGSKQTKGNNSVDFN